jgi:hypothetical protein
VHNINNRTTLAARAGVALWQDDVTTKQSSVMSRRLRAQAQRPNVAHRKPPVEMHELAETTEPYVIIEMPRIFVFRPLRSPPALIVGGHQHDHDQSLPKLMQLS